MGFKFVFCSKGMKTIQTRYLKDTAIFLQTKLRVCLRLKSLKEQLVFHGLSYILKHKEDIFFSFLAYKT